MSEYETASDEALKKVLYAIEDDNYLAVFEQMNQPDFDINQSNSNHFTPLALAVSFGKPIFVELFLSMGANPFDGGGKTNAHPLELINNDLYEKDINAANSEKITCLLKQYRNARIPDCDKWKPNWRQGYNAAQPLIAAIKKANISQVQEALSADEFIYTHSGCHDIFKNALTLAVETKSLQIVQLLVERGASVTTPGAREVLEKHANEAWTRPIQALFEETKQKQLDTMRAFCDESDPIKKQIVFNKIKQLNTYGETLKSKGVKPKGQKVITLAEKLFHTFNAFVQEKKSHKETMDELSSHIKQGQSTMGDDRNITDILAHFCLALTGVGLVMMCTHKAFYGSFFLNSTKRQDMLNEISHELHNLKPGAS